MFGLADSEVTTLVNSVAHRDDGENIAEGVRPEVQFARAAWSVISEPGDGTAGALLRGVGPVRALNFLIEQCSAESICRSIDETQNEIDDQNLSKALTRWQPRLKSSDVVRALKSAAHVGATLVTPEQESWPVGLNDLGRHMPHVLWRRGDASTVLRVDRSVALVGARAATGYGEHVAMEFSAGLAERGFTITSGAAYGIDGMAHRAALAGSGTTVAFLAGGVDRFYPSGHDSLLSRIACEGAVYSEVACGSAPTRWRFLQRNRLIAAACQATVVVEAGRRSGSLNTAGHAAALGRAVGAVPGPVTNPTSLGCHRLIREYDATCVSTLEEVVELVGGNNVQDSAEGDRYEISADQTRVLDALSFRSARTPADAAVRCGLSIPECLAVLGSLEIERLVVEREYGWVRAKR